MATSEQVRAAFRALRFSAGVGSWRHYDEWVCACENYPTHPSDALTRGDSCTPGLKRCPYCNVVRPPMDERPTDGNE